MLSWYLREGKRQGDISYRRKLIFGSGPKMGKFYGIAKKRNDRKYLLDPAKCGLMPTVCE